METCDALWTVLQPAYLKSPDEAAWQKSADTFGDSLGFPNCCGAIDGKHIQIKAPNNSGTMFYNYLKTFSIILLAVCDADKNFLYVDIGAYGGQSDGGVLQQSSLGRKIYENTLNLPSPKELLGSVIMFPHFIIADAAFPLKKNIQKPYGGQHLNEQQTYYNERLNSVRKVIENTFGILTQRWRIFLGPIHAQPESVDKFVKAAVVLHNFIKSYKDQNNRYQYVDDIDEANLAFHNIRWGARNATQQSKELRDEYAAYLFSIKTKNNK